MFPVADKTNGRDEKREYSKPLTLPAKARAAGRPEANVPGQRSQANCFPPAALSTFDE
jgi:hypothetical protein